MNFSASELLLEGIRISHSRCCSTGASALHQKRPHCSTFREKQMSCRVYGFWWIGQFEEISTGNVKESWWLQRYSRILWRRNTLRKAKRLLCEQSREKSRKGLPPDTSDTTQKILEARGGSKRLFVIFSVQVRGMMCVPSLNQGNVIIFLLRGAK